MDQPQRYIAHYDLDSFFVSVEVVKDPTLAGKPVIVGGSTTRGVVSTCSYEARKFGVHSAMSMKKAIELCPNAILVRGSMQDYSMYSKWVTEIIASNAPSFEKASIDEFYVDLTGMDKFFNPFTWALELRNQIIEQTKLPISFGLASNKMVAKIATSAAKPNGVMFVQPGKEKEFLAPLSVSVIPGVGKYVQGVLEEMNIKIIEDILKYPVAILEKKLGKWGGELYKKAQGINTSSLHFSHQSKSISTERTFEENTMDLAFIQSELTRMTEKVGYQLRKEKKLTTCAAIKIRYADFKTYSKQIAIAETCCDDEILPKVTSLFNKLYQKNKPIRLLGVRLTGIIDHAIQTNLFSDTSQKIKLYQALDGINNKYGKYSVKNARVMKSPSTKSKNI